MTISNEFLDFCNTDTGTNLLTQADYLAAADRISGNKPGVASARLVNKALRQSSFVVGQFAQWIANKLNAGVLDNGSDSTLLAQIYSALAPNDSFALENVAFAVSVGANALTVALKTSAGTDPSAADVAYVSFRNATLGTGIFVRRAITAALSITIPSGTTIGTLNGITTPIFIGFLDNGGTAELTLSLSSYFDEGRLQNSTAISTGASSTTLYSTASRSTLPYRLAGRLIVAEATAGTWATAPTEVCTLPFRIQKQQWVGPVQTVVGTATGATYATPTNAPSITYIPERTGRHRIHGNFIVEAAVANHSVSSIITATAGGTPSIFYNQSGTIAAGGGSVNAEGMTPLELYCDLVAGTSYTFTLQLKDSSTGQVNVRNDFATNGQALIAEEV